MSTTAYEGFLVRIWQTEDGLPQNTVTSITQSADGYLWVGTYAGLARFDGARFHTYDVMSSPALSDERIASLYPDSRDTLWIGSESGQTFQYRGGEIERVFIHQHPEARVSGFMEDGRGAMWVLRADGEFAPLDQTQSPVESATGKAEVLSFARGPHGKCWVSIGGVPQQLDRGVVSPIDFGPAKLTGYVRAMAASRDGQLWVVRDGRIRKWVSDHWTEDRGVWDKEDITGMIELSNGALAIGTMASGVELRYPDGHALKLDYDHCSIQNWIRALYEDREGNLWIAGGSGGLAMVRKTAFGTLSPPDRWQGRTVLCVVAGKQGELWAGTEGAGAYVYRHGQWTHYDHENGLTGLYIWSATLDDHGNAWLGTWSDGIFRQSGDRFTLEPELNADSKRVLGLRWMDKTLLAGTANGLIEEKDGSIVRHDVGMVVDFVYDSAGTLWLALQEGGVARLTAKGVEKLIPDQGLARDSVQCLLSDGDVLWMGTQNGGLDRLKAGQVSHLGLKMNLPSRVICHIEDDGLGYLWLSTHKGIVRVAKRDLNDGAENITSHIPSETFDQNDGLPTLEYSGGLQAAGCRSPDGRLWFTSNRGLASVNPSELPLNPLPPPVRIESFQVDGKSTETLLSTAALKLMPEHERIEIEYTALSLAAPGKVRFKYRLRGLEKEWIDAGPKRTASYSHLPPGKYTFQVIACNNDGVWNMTGQSLALMVEPFFWQTWWFQILSGLLAASIIALLVRNSTRRRMQRKLDELEYERGIERERMRIAQDLHDDIGSTLTRISMLSQTSGADLQSSDRTAAVLSGINRATLKVTQTLDEIVWAVNPRHDRLDSLVSYISRLAQETLAEAGVSCHTDLPVELPAWRIAAPVRHNILLAFKEVLNNIIKHSGANHVEIALVLHTAGLTLSIQDNGAGKRGKNEDSSGPNRVLGGNGLDNIRQRLAEIGGKADFVRSSEQGWRVIFTLDQLNPP